MATFCGGVAASSGARPAADSVCTVHYTGRLEDGTVFDSSRDRGTPFEFPLGQGHVIKGWDLGVATMKRGEKAILTIDSSLGYGDSGAGNVIPGGATLDFEVELLDWKEGGGGLDFATLAPLLLSGLLAFQIARFAGFV